MPELPEVVTDDDLPELADLVIEPDVDDQRYHVVTIDGGRYALSRPGPDGTWRMLTPAEAESLAQAWNDDPREGSTAVVAEVVIYDRDPAHYSSGTAAETARGGQGGGAKPGPATTDRIGDVAYGIGRDRGGKVTVVMTAFRSLDDAQTTADNANKQPNVYADLILGRQPDDEYFVVERAWRRVHG